MSPSDTSSRCSRRKRKRPKHTTLLTLLDSPVYSAQLAALLLTREQRHLAGICRRAAQSEFREQFFARGVWVLPSSRGLIEGANPFTRGLIKHVVVHDPQHLKFIAEFGEIKTVTVRSRYRPVCREDSEDDVEYKQKPVVDLSGPWPPSMTKLDLSGARVTNLSKLGALTQLETLVLPEEESETYSSALERLNNLKSVSMTMSSSKGGALDFVKNNPNIGKLRLWVRRDTLFDAPALGLAPLVDAKLKNLHSLKIAGVRGRVAVVNLANVLEAYRTSLKDLRLTDIKLDDADVHTTAAAVCSLIGTLEVLKFEVTGFRSWDSIDESKVNSALRYLDIRGMEIEELEFVRKMPLLEKLRVSMLDEEMDWSPLGTLTHLKLLDLGEYFNESEYPPRFHEVLARLPHLSTLKNPPDIFADSPLQHVRSLEVHTTYKPNGLTNWTILEDVYWGGWCSTELLCTFPRTLLHLGLKLENRKINLSYIGQMTQLRSLVLHHWDGYRDYDEDRDYGFLSELTQLESLELVDEPIADIEALRSTPHLRQLVLKKTRVTDVSPLLSLAELEYVDLRDTKAVDITKLKTLPSLKVLRLQS